MSNPDSISQTLAEALREIADKLAPLDLAVKPWVRLDLQPSDKAEADQVATCDAIAVALFGKPGEARNMSNGTWHHNAAGHVGPVAVSTYTAITAPADREREAELERLKAELAERQAELENLRARAGEPEVVAVHVDDFSRGGAL
jgi:hypothetical protein